MVHHGELLPLRFLEGEQVFKGDGDLEAVFRKHSLTGLIFVDSEKVQVACLVLGKVIQIVVLPWPDSLSQLVGQLNPLWESLFSDGKGLISEGIYELYSQK